MAHRRGALLAAAATQASTGLAMAVVINGCGGGHKAVLVFVLCTAGVALSDLVLVPGWVWHPRRPVVPRLLGRALAAVVALAVAVFAGFISMLLVIAVGVQLSDHVASPLRDYVLVALPFGIGGAVAGLGAAMTETADVGPDRPQPQRQPPFPPHIIGGAIGVLPVLLLAVAADQAGGAGQPPALTWWPLLGLTPAALVAGGTVRNVLLARNAARAGVPLADGAGTMWRAMVCCIPMAAFALVAVVVAESWSWMARAG